MIPSFVGIKILQTYVLTRLKIHLFFLFSFTNQILAGIRHYGKLWARADFHLYHHFNVTGSRWVMSWALRYDYVITVNKAQCQCDRLNVQNSIPQARVPQAGPDSQAVALQRRRPLPAGGNRAMMEACPPPTPSTIVLKSQCVYFYLTWFTFG